MATATPVNTKKVTGRREVSYSSYDDLLADARQLASGEVQTLGNWNFGQILKHLAAGVNTAVDGAPFNVPAPFRWLASRFLKGMFLNKTLKPGFKFPSSAKPVLQAPDETTVEEGLAALEAAVERVRSATEFKSHVMLGDLTPEEHEKFQLRHAEMHMSFVQPAS